MQRILAKAETIRTDFIVRHEGVAMSVLLEGKKGEYRVGWTPNYIQRKMI